MKIIKQAKSIDRLIKDLKGNKPSGRRKPSDSTGVSSDDAISNLIQLQREAVQSELEKSTIKPVGVFKGMRQAEKVQEEYEVAKTGIKSRYGKIAKLFGADEGTSKMLDQLFGKQVSSEELKKLREKYKIKSPEQIKEEKAKIVEKKAKITEEKKQKSLQRDEKINSIENLSQKIHEMINGIRLTIDGIANKLGAEKAKDITMKDGKFFDAEGKRIKKGKIEKQAGLKYSKESQRYRDISTGRFIGAEKARQRMNLVSTAVRATPGVGAVAGAALAAGTGLASKVVGKEEIAVDDTGAKIDALSKKIDGSNKGIKSILDMFSLKKFYGLIGGAIGFAFPFLKKAVEWIWGFAKQGWQWIKDVGSNIWEYLKGVLVKIKFTMPGGPTMPDWRIMGPLRNKKLWQSKTFQPFSFLQAKEESIESPPSTAPPAETTTTGTASPQDVSAGSANVTPAPAAAPTAPAAAPPAAAPPAAAPPAPAAAAPSAARAGTSMPAGGPPLRLGPAAAQRGRIDPSAGKNAALASAAKFGITGPHLAQFMAQLDHESGGFKHVEENLRYSAEGLMKTFPKYYKDKALAEAEARQPILIANRVYGGRMGNAKDEGYKYRGRGLIQLTGKDNYAKYGKIVGMDLVGNPDMAGDLATAADIAAAYYKKQVIDKGINATDTTKVTKAINGGSIGLSHREQLYASYSKDPSLLKATGPAPEPMLASAEQPAPAAANRDIVVSGGSGGTSTNASMQVVASSSAVPSSAVPAAVAATPTATPVAPAPSLGYAVAADSNAVSVAKEQMVAAAPAPPFVPVPVGGGSSGAALMKPAAAPVRATSRHSEDSFVRALAKDFAHPSAFTTIGTV